MIPFRNKKTRLDTLFLARPYMESNEKVENSITIEDKVVVRKERNRCNLTNDIIVVGKRANLFSSSLGLKVGNSAGSSISLVLSSIRDYLLLVWHMSKITFQTKSVTLQSIVHRLEWKISQSSYLLDITLKIKTTTVCLWTFHSRKFSFGSWMIILCRQKYIFWGNVGAKCKSLKHLALQVSDQRCRGNN